MKRVLFSRLPGGGSELVSWISWRGSGVCWTILQAWGVECLGSVMCLGLEC